MKDLGILISGDLKRSPHIAQIVSNASFSSHRILKTFSSKNIWTLVKAFVTYVRPKLEYNTSVWPPHLKSNIKCIESVQKVFTRRACIRCNISFSSDCDRLYKLNLKPLENRRLEFDLILTYKICYCLIDIDFNDFFVCDKANYNLRRHTLVLRCKHKPKHDSFRYFFCYRIISVWNLLPESVVTSTTLIAFKKCLNKFDLHTICSFVY